MYEVSLYINIKNIIVHTVYAQLYMKPIRNLNNSILIYTPLKDY